MIEWLVLAFANALKVAVLAAATLTAEPTTDEATSRPAHVPGVNPICPGMMILM